MSCTWTQYAIFFFLEPTYQICVLSPLSAVPYQGTEPLHNDSTQPQELPMIYKIFVSYQESEVKNNEYQGSYLRVMQHRFCCVVANV